MGLEPEATPNAEGHIYKSTSWGNYFLIIVLVLFATLMTFEQGLVPTNVDPIQVHFGIGEGLLGVIVGTYTIIIACMTLLFGYLADKSVRIRLIFLGCIIWSVCGIFSYLSAVMFRNIGLFAMFRILAGVGLGCLMPCAFSLISDIVRSGGRSKAFAIWGLVSTSGAAIGAILGMDLYAQYDVSGQSDLWTSYFLYLGIAGLFLLVFFLFFREPKRAATDDALKRVLSKEELAYSYRVKLSDLKNIYKRRSNFWLIVNFIDTIYPGLLILWVFDYLMDSFGLSEGQISTEMITFLLMLIVGLLGGTILFSWLGDRWFKRGNITARAKIAVYCALLTNPFVIFAFIEPLSPMNYWWIGIFLALGLGINMGIGPNWYATIIDVNLPENRGTMIATANFLDNIGRALGQMIGGFMIAYLTVYGAFQWATIFVALQIPFWIPVLRNVRHDLQEVNDILEERAKELEAPTE